MESTEKHPSVFNKVSIVILSYNNLDYTRLCLDSVRRFTTQGCYEVIVIDNNSTDGAREWLAQQQNIKCIFNDYNAGFPGGCNQSIKAAEDGNDILLLNNDTIVTQNWLDNLERCLYSDGSVGAVGAVTNSCSNNQMVALQYKGIDEMFSLSAQNNVSDPKRWEERLRLVGFCYLIKNKALKEVGLLDERFSPGNFEDDDYSLRLRLAGYRLMLCHDCFIHHFGSASFSKENERFRLLLETNAKKFFDKWNVDPLSFNDERLALAKYLPRESPQSILHINSSTGGTLLFLNYLYPSAWLYGVEANEKLYTNLGHAVLVRADIAAFYGKKIDLIVVSSNSDGEQPLLQVMDAAQLFHDNTVLIFITPQPAESAEKLGAFFPDLVIKTDSNAVILKGQNRQMMINRISGRQLKEMNYDYSASSITEKEFSYLLHRLDFRVDYDRSLQTIKEVLKTDRIESLLLKKMIHQKIYHKDAIIEIIRSVYSDEALNKKTGQNQSSVIMSTQNGEITLFEKILSEIEFGKDIDNNVERLCNMVRDGKIDKTVIDEAVTSSLDKASVLNAVGTAFYNEGQKEDALYYFIEAYKFDAENRDLIYNLASTLFELGNKADALDVIKSYQKSDDGLTDLEKMMIETT